MLWPIAPQTPATTSRMRSMVSVMLDLAANRALSGAGRKCYVCRMRGAFLFLGSVVSIVVACGGADESTLFDGGGTPGDDGGIKNDVVVPVDTGSNCEPTCVTIPQ